MKQYQKIFLGICILCLLGAAGWYASDNDASQITQLDTKYLLQEDTDTAETLQPIETKTPTRETESGSSQNTESSDKTTSSDETETEDTAVKEEESEETKTQSKKKSTAAAPKSTASSAKKSASKKKNTKKTQSSQSSNTNASPIPTSDTEDAKDTETETCTIAIDCKTILSNIDKLNSAKKTFVPSDGWILKKTEIPLESGDSVYDILRRACRQYDIHMEAAYTPTYKSYYVEGIHQLYEFDCGDLSGWNFLVNGESPNYGASKYKVAAGDAVCWRYTCNAGKDLSDG